MPKDEPALGHNPQAQKVALRFIFKKILVKNQQYAQEFERTITCAQLFTSDVDIECSATADNHARVIFRDGTLYVKTTSEIDVHIANEIPASFIHIETGGQVTFSNSCSLPDSFNLFVAARSIVMNMQMVHGNFVALKADQKNGGFINFKRKLGCNFLFLETSEFSYESSVQAVKAKIACHKILSTRSGNLVIGDAHRAYKHHNTTWTQSDFARSHHLIIAEMLASTRSEISTVEALIINS